MRRTLSSNFVFTIWAVFGGFILHFLLCNFLTVLLRPRYEKPVETTADIIERNITLILWPEAGWKEYHAASPDPISQEFSKRIVTAKNWNEYEEMVHKVISTGMYALIGTTPIGYYVSEEEHKDWYRSSETVPEDHPYLGHLSNKKWPLKKVL